MKKSGFKVGKKVYTKYSDEVLYMYSLTTDENFVVCTTDPLGYVGKRSLEYKNISIKPSKGYIQSEKKYLHSLGVVEVFKDVEALYELRKSNPTHNEAIVELMRPYIGNARFWDFVLHTAADSPLLHEKIKELLTISKD